MMTYPNFLKRAIWVGCSIVALSACSEWTETESIVLEENGVNQQNPAAYAKYLENLANYKKSDHKVTYGWFDNSEKTPYTRGQHLADVPDSLDAVVLNTPQLSD